MLLVKSFSGLNKYCFCCGNWIVKLWLDCRPSTIDALLIVDGVSERQCERFGEQLVNCVATFCKENNLEADKFSTDQPDSGSPTTSQVCTVRYIFQVGRKTRPKLFCFAVACFDFPVWREVGNTSKLINGLTDTGSQCRHCMLIPKLALHVII